LFQGILASLDPVLVHFGFTANSEKGFHLKTWVRAILTSEIFCE
jgi:hypothetical protein